MIVTIHNNTTPVTAKGLATYIDGTVITRVDDDTPEAFADFCMSDYECCHEELVLAETDPLKDENWKSDKSSFLFRLSLPTDTVTIKLYKIENGLDVLKATLNTNALGTYFPASYFPDQLKIGFQLDWRLVLTAYGSGKYFVEADRVIINRNSSLKSHDFRLYPYNEFIADGTIRIQSFSTGIIEGGINYMDFEWEQMVRLRGTFGNAQPSQESDTYEDTLRNTLQIQEQIKTDYDLLLEPIPVDVAKPLIYDKLLANTILISDYNLFNYDKYRDFPVYPKEPIDTKYNTKTAKGMFSWRFVDKTQNIIKRNFQ